MFTDLFQADLSLSGAWIPQSDDSSLFPAGDYADLHQAEMFDAMNDDDIAAILNTNPTGAGKTLSWVAPTIRSGERGKGWIVLATYPTKALVEDQYETILALFERYYGSTEFESNREFWLTDDGGLTNGSRTYALSERVVQVTSDSVSGSTTSKINETHNNALDPAGDGIPTIILTTPDTLTAIAANLPFDRDEVSVLVKFDKIVIDEFHLAGARGKRLLPFHLDVALGMSKFVELDTLVFLSATPLPNYVNRVKNAFETVHITDETYDSPSVKARQILPEVTLSVTSREMFTNGRWLAENIEKLVDFYDSSGQMLIIVDSVREVDDVYEAFKDETDLQPGRIYGWKKSGRSETIADADVVVGNTAVEVGIDFSDVNRVVTTAYDHTSAIQRIGRMRYRQQISDYEIALITTSSVQSAVVREGHSGSLTRTALGQILLEELGEITEIPYYEFLCASYCHYLWFDSVEYRGDTRLREFYSEQDGITAEERYSELVYKHFVDGVNEVYDDELDVQSLWNEVSKLREMYYKDSDGEYPVFREMHTYRPSSLSCMILDEYDEEEPIKVYSLAHVLRHCTGYLVDGTHGFIAECEKRGMFNDTAKQLIEQQSSYVCAYFVFTGKLESGSRYYKIGDIEWTSSKKSFWERPGSVGPMWNPSVETDPVVEGTEYIDLDNQLILARYVDYPKETVIEGFNLGPYANVAHFGNDGSVLFWDDAILAEAHIAHQFFKEYHESK